MSARLFLVRHGALEKRDFFLGSYDVPLSEQGREQVKALALRLKHEFGQKILAIGCSDLTRSLESATLLQSVLAPHIPLEIDASLREISLGLWEGRDKNEVKRIWQGCYAMRGLQLEKYVPSGGESFWMLARRVKRCLKEWSRRFEERDGIVLLITHAGVMRVAIAEHMALPLSDVLRIPLDYASYCEIPMRDFRGSEQREGGHDG